MTFSVTKTRSSIGIFAKSVAVEVHISNGLPGFTIVGLPETAVKESRDRVRSAILNSQFDFPCRKIIVNLAPADLPKAGSGFDLPIAIGILAASGQITKDKLDNTEFIGELALNGDLRGVSPVIPAVLASFKDNKSLIIPIANAEEASLVGHNNIHIASSLREVCSYFCQNTALASPPPPPDLKRQDEALDWSEVKGQGHAKLAMEIAACGGHSILLSGPPGSGKTMLAKRFVTLLPELTESQALESAAIHSLKGRLPDYNYWRQPPFRAPHHTVSSIALVGGGNPLKPGEISLAHHGVLFLDELPEFHRHALETLREPLESGIICISRANSQVEYPAYFQLIAAMNPCPCGHFGNPEAHCICSMERILRYQAKLSAPFMERIDMHISVEPLKDNELLEKNHNTPRLSTEIRKTVKKIRERQQERQGCLNASLGPKALEEHCKLSTIERTFLQDIIKKLKLSARGYHRLLKVARTITDIEEAKQTEICHLRKALSFRHTKLDSFN